MEKGRFEDDATLIRSCVERDHSAWDFFVKKYSNHILISIVFRLRKYGIHLKVEDLKEIEQDTLSLLWEGSKLAEIRNPESLRYWLAIISGNTAVQYMRRQKRLDRLAAKSLSETIGGTEMADMLPSSVLTPAQELERSELSEKIEKALESLPDKEKLALKLSLLYGKKYDEISGIMAMPPGTVSSYIKRAKKRLRKKLQQFSGF